MTRQIRRLGLALLLLFVALFAKLNQLQVLQASDLANHPGNNRKVVRDFSSPRGGILASDGAVLARSVPSQGTFGQQREYPEGALFGHITGFFSFTYGATGVERSYADDLAGRSAAVRIRSPEDLLRDRDITGDVVLTISKRVQQAARDALGDRKGSVVAIDPRNGALLALWSFPSYDPNPLAGHDQSAVQAAYQALIQDPNRPLLARSYRDRYPPGSTFKVVTAAAVLERRPELAGVTQPVLTELDLPQTNRNLRNFGGSRCGGSLPDLLRVSCNTGFAQLGIDLGAEALAAEAAEFGFGSKPPIDLPAAATSVFPDASAFERNIPALAYSAIGQQDVAATPLEMALVVAGIGNGGSIMRPHVMQEVRSSVGGTARRWEPVEWRRAMSPEAAATLRDMMVGVATSGTARAAQVPGVTTAAKTGTAQTGTGRAHAWLVAFAPAEAPTVAVAVIVEDQPEVSENTGGRLAAPIARAVMQAALAP